MSGSNKYAILIGTPPPISFENLLLYKKQIIDDEPEKSYKKVKRVLFLDEVKEVEMKKSIADNYKFAEEYFFDIIEQK